MPYAPIVLPADLTTHIYPEVLNEITRDDTTKSEAAIDMAIQEAKVYLTRYDLVKIFGDQATDTAATFAPDSHLLNMIKTIAIWQLMSLGNANLYYDTWKGRYESVIRSLKEIQSGRADPRWPYFDTTGETAPPSDQVTSRSNPKRTNHW